MDRPRKPLNLAGDMQELREMAVDHSRSDTRTPISLWTKIEHANPDRGKRTLTVPALAGGVLT